MRSSPATVTLKDAKDASTPRIIRKEAPTVRSAETGSKMPFVETPLCPQKSSSDWNGRRLVEMRRSEQEEEKPEIKLEEEALLLFLWDLANLPNLRPRVNLFLLHLFPKIVIKIWRHLYRHRKSSYRFLSHMRMGTYQRGKVTS